MYTYYNYSGDYGPHPHVGNMVWESGQNSNFRRAYWTGEQMQMTLMSVPIWENLGLEMIRDIEQMIRVEQGQGLIQMGADRNRMAQQYVSFGDVAFVPAGTWYNVWNTGSEPLKLSIIYVPAHEDRGALQENKE